MVNPFYLFIAFFAASLQWGTIAGQSIDHSASLGKREISQQNQALFDEESNDAKIALSYEELARFKLRKGPLSRTSLLAAAATAFATAAIVLVIFKCAKALSQAYQDEGLERRLAGGGTCGGDGNEEEIPPMQGGRGGPPYWVSAAREGPQTLWLHSCLALLQKTPPERR
ncbi:hypothetical protein Emag_005840 [Eimeria magna]